MTASSEGKILEINILFSKDIKLVTKVTAITFTLLQKITILSKYCSFELFIHQRTQKKNVSQFPQKYLA